MAVRRSLSAGRLITERLSSVVIKNLDFRNFIARWDREGMLFYCDPPYYDNESD